jgi:hypothetical protein
MRACGSRCADVQVDKGHCGSCGNACEAYQYCEGGKCLPQYAGTKLFPMAMGTGRNIFDIAAVSSASSADDLFLLFASNGIRLSEPNATTLVNFDAGATVLARFDPEGVLIWARDLKSVFSAERVASRFALAKNSDVFVKFQWETAPSGPVAGTTVHSVARLSGNDAHPIWKSDLDPVCNNVVSIVHRPKPNDVVVVTELDFGNVCQVVDLGSSAQSYFRATVFSLGAAVGADEHTFWSWGAHGGTFQTNPWSTATWTVTSNPTSGGGYDAFIVGARDDGSTIGPWFSEGDYQPGFKIITEPSGDLIVAVDAWGYTTFNGGQLLAKGRGGVLVRLRHADGKVLWRTELPFGVAQLINLPGGRVGLLEEQPLGTADVPIRFHLYSVSDGVLSASVVAGGANPVSTNLDGTSVGVAAGGSDLFIVGTVGSPADFDPGKGEESLGNTPGLFISRYKF